MTEAPIPDHKGRLTWNLHTDIFNLIGEGFNLLNYGKTEDFAASLYKACNHVLAYCQDGMNYIMDYDGQNRQALVSSSLGMPLLFANDFQHVYQLTTTTDKVKLSAVSLIANKD